MPWNAPSVYLTAILFLVPELLVCESPITRSAWGQDGSKPLRVMTYNIRYANPQDGPDRWEQRRERVAQEIAGMDIVGLQEVLGSQLKYLQEKLGDEWVWYGVGRDDGAEKGEYSPLGIRTDRFRIREKGVFWLSPTPETVGSKGWDAALPRIATWVIIDRKLEQDENPPPKPKSMTVHPTWLVVNTHYDHIGMQAREESSKLIAERIQKMSQGASGVIFMGDLNATPTDAAYRSFALATDLRDARDITTEPPRGPAGTWNGFQAIIETRRIDHIFVSPLVDVLAYEVLDPRTSESRFASDHLPVLVEVSEKPRAQQ